MILEQTPFQGEVVQIVDGKWTNEVSLQVKDTTESGVRKLSLSNNKRATIIMEIAHVHFLCLTYLVLDGNNIESIEGLCRVRMPHMQILWLGNNNLTSVGAIRKALWASLQKLCICNNYFGEAKHLTQGYFPQISTLLVYHSWIENNPFTQQDFPAKLQTAFMNYLWVNQKKFSFYRCIRGVLKKRWLDISV